MNNDGKITEEVIKEMVCGFQKKGSGDHNLRQVTMDKSVLTKHSHFPLDMTTWLLA